MNTLSLILKIIFIFIAVLCLILIGIDKKDIYWILKWRPQ